jgi:hypothetical protein
MGTTVVNGVTFINTTGSVRWADIAATQGNSYSSLSQLRGRKWYKSDFTRGNFPSSGSFSLSSFRGTSGSLPRVDRTDWPAAGKFFFVGNITLPPGFNKISFRVYGPGGGGGGGNGAQCIAYNSNGTCANAITVNGGGGGTGGTTSIVTAAGTYSSTGGAGGNQGATGANGSPDPGAASDFIAGGTGNGSGGKGGRNYTTAVDADVDFATASSMFGQTCTTTYGAGGTGGTAGSGNLSTGPSGAAGGGGGITVVVDEGLY